MKYLAIAATILAFAACNTVRGAGEDIAAGGEIVQEGAVETEEAIKQSTY